jgi:hypothetical protein
VARNDCEAFMYGYNQIIDFKGFEARSHA